MAWAGTQADFAEHLAVCRAKEVKWCDTRAKTARGATSPTPEEQARASLCQAGFDAAAGGPEAGMQVAPCNAYKLTAKKADSSVADAYAEKLRGLQATVEGLVDTEQVQVLAFQEVKSDAVLREVLGKRAVDFDTCVAPHTAFQTVGFAWKRSLSTRPGACRSETGLAIKEKLSDPTSIRQLRPGLSLELEVGGAMVTFMNVHLKSSCANLRTGGGFPGRELTASDPACKVLNRQVVPLEDWIERVAQRSPRFVLLGDFNRRLDEEAKAGFTRKTVRLDRTDPAGPNHPDASGNVPSRVLWQEISDGAPNLYQVGLDSAATGCKGFLGLDHILVSDAIRTAQPGGIPSSRKLPVTQVPKQKIQTSDHCPRVTALQL